jgi:acetyl-CoA synthetase
MPPAPLEGPALLQLADLADSQLRAGRGADLALRWCRRDGATQDFSYADLVGQAVRLAGHFRQLGVAPGDVVAVMTGRHPETVIAALAIWKVGAVYCPLYADLGPDPLLARLRLATVKLALIGSEAYAAALRPLQGVADYPARLLFHGDQLPPGCLSLADLLMREPVAPPLPPEACASAALLHFTSGTTAPINGGAAQPRAVCHDQRLLARLVSSAGQAFGIGAGDRLWCTGEPGWALHSAFGLIVPLALGASIILDQRPPTPTRCLTILEEQAVDIWYTTPSVIRALMGAGTAAVRSPRRRLRLAASVGEPLSADAVIWGAAALGVPFRDSWWQTETGGVVLAPPLHQPPRPGSMGRALPGLTLRLVQRDGAGLRFLPDDGEAEGELAILSDDLAPWDSLGGSDKAAVDRIDGWHLSHDLMRRDSEGDYWFLSRDDDLIKRAGRLVGPFEVEQVLMAHPAVAEVGVVGAPGDGPATHLAAFVALNPGFAAGAALRQELRQFGLDRLGPILAPDEIHFRTALPRTPSGKIIRARLKALLPPPVD